MNQWITPAMGNLSWLWLFTGIILLPFTAIQTVLPLAAWLSPVFILRFTRIQQSRKPLFIMAFCICLAMTIAARNISPFPVVYLAGIAFGLKITIGYVIDYILTPQLSGLKRTLVFPLAFTTIDWLTALGPYTTWSSPAYSLYGELPLMQLVSVTGLWGVTFLLAWFASTINALWEQEFNLGSAYQSVAPFLITLFIIILFGNIRLAFFPPDSTTVRIASMAYHPSPHDVSIPQASVLSDNLAERKAIRTQLMHNIDRLLALTQQEARAGSKIITWNETASVILAEDTPEVFEHIQKLARQEQIYLQVNFVVSLQTDHYPYGENQAIMVDPSGTIVWNYQKSYPAPGESYVGAPDSEIVPTVETPYGKLSTVICFDAFVPNLVRESEKQRSDIVLVPSFNQKPTTYTSSKMITFRAIESGFSLVRLSQDGLSLAADYRGQVLGASDYFYSDPAVMVTFVPTKGVRTIYSIIGNSFAYLCVLGLLALMYIRVKANSPKPTNFLQYSIKYH